jgi:hypothetical protein
MKQASSSGRKVIKKGYVLHKVSQKQHVFIGGIISCFKLKLTKKVKQNLYKRDFRKNLVTKSSEYVFHTFYSGKTSAFKLA